MSDFKPYQLYGIIGHPLGHSMSPMLHTTAFKALNIPAVLVPWSLPPEKLQTFIDAFRLLGIKGACVTIPYKQSIIPYLDEVTDRVKAMGAANLIYDRDGKICGDNTDVLGFMAPLKENPPAADSKILLMGAGGAARAVVAGLQALGFKDITVTDIVPELPEALVKTFGLKQIPWDKRHEAPATVVINATPMGMKGKFEGETAYPAEWFAGRRGLAYDVVYTPFETRFQKEAKAAGWATVSGLKMFMAQADAQFHTWTGQHLPDEAKQTVIDALSQA
ncbi:shikimate dehydrogenase [Deltaproteobacteria bacterium OttesenSCG-928-K17]|nr:shikimate dehydrogenase [Deltaproteobacteria bacterium OttesenSCG-928-K17]